MLKTIKEYLENTFHKIFSNSHLLYTLIFFLFILIITLFSFASNPQLGNIALFIATTTSLTFIFMMIISLYPKLENTFFLSEKIFEKRKVITFLIIFMINFILILVYFLTGSSSQVPIQFLGWDLLLPVFFVITYFGWNIIQIFFIKTGFEDISIKIDTMLIDTKRNTFSTESLSLLFLVVALIIPVLMQVGTLFGLLNYFQPQTSGDPQDPLYWYVGWNVVMFIIIFIMSFRLVCLFIQSKKKEAPNIYSSMFYLLIWIVIWFRSFSFVNAFRTVASAVEIDAFRIFMDIVLMIITAIIVLRGLGDKVYKYRIFTENNLPFFLFSFALLYIEGQVIMITGAGAISSIYTDFKQVSLVNNFIVLLVSVIFYWWYAKYSLEQKGFIFKDSFKPREIFTIMKDFRNHLEYNGIIESNKVSDQDIQSFLQNKKILVLKQEPEKDQEPQAESQIEGSTGIVKNPYDLEIKDDEI